jgi:hypothetical protein
MVDTKSDLSNSEVVQANKKTCNYSKNILKQLVGLEKAENALKSISMGALPTIKDGKLFSFDCKDKSFLTACFSNCKSTKLWRLRWSNYESP